MATILCLETATTNCSVTLSVDGSVIAFKEDNTPGYSHSEKLHVFIDAILAESKVSKRQLDAVAVSKGPGSYTGLRIGVSAAKGLCYALDIPLISIPTLQSLALQISHDVDLIIPLLDARRMEVYAAVFNSEVKEIRETRAEILEANSFSEYLESGTVAFVGSGVEKFQKICESENAIFLPNLLPRSQEMVELSEAKYNTQQFEDVAYFEPYYLKDFIAG